MMDAKARARILYHLISFDADEVIKANDDMLFEEDSKKKKKNIEDMINGLSEIENYLGIYANNVMNLRSFKSTTIQGK